MGCLVLETKTTKQKSRGWKQKKLTVSDQWIMYHTNIFSVRRWSLRVIDRRKETRKGKEIKREISQAHVILFGGSGSCGQKDLFELQACQMVSGEPMLFFSSAMIDPWPWGECFIWLQCRTEYHRLCGRRNSMDKSVI